MGDSFRGPSRSQSPHHPPPSGGCRPPRPRPGGRRALAGRRPVAQATSSDSYLVTFVARQCPTYQDITANLARNNIQESLQDLGADTAYVSGQPISPTIETPNQPNCTPLTGWQFQFGDGINGQTPGTNLSQVSDPVRPSLHHPGVGAPARHQRQPDRQLDRRSGHHHVDPSQVSQAANHQLWVQGGTATDPLGAATFGAGKYGFGALRCAVDNLNGDNVEWVGFPSGQTHVFCYYYAVTPPSRRPPSPWSSSLARGRSRPEVVQLPGDRLLQQSRRRLHGVDGELDELRPRRRRRRGTSGSWSRTPTTPTTRPTCSAPTSISPPSPARAPSAPAPSAGSASVPGPRTSRPPTPRWRTWWPGRGTTSTCTYVDDPNVAQLSVFKQTVGGVGGTFPITVTPPSGPAHDWTATTAVPDTPVPGRVDGGPDRGCAGAVHRQRDRAGRPRRPGRGRPPGLRVQRRVRDAHRLERPRPGDGAGVNAAPETAFDCLFTNTFTPKGPLTITKTTMGGIGTTQFAA